MNTPVWSIRAKLWSVLVFFAAAYLGTVLLEWRQSIMSDARLKRVASSTFQASLMCDQAQWSFQHQVLSYQDGVQMGETSVFTTADADGKHVQDLLSTTIALPEIDQADRDAVRRLQVAHRAFTADAAVLYPKLASESSSSSRQEEAHALYRRLEDLKKDFAALTDRFVHLVRDELGSTVTMSRHQREVDTIAFAIVSTGTVLLIALMVRQITSRMHKLVDASDRLAGGDFRPSLEDPIDDEIGALASSFIAMRDAVGYRDQQLRDMNTSLEATIAERTEELSKRNAELERVIADLGRAHESLRLLESAVTQMKDEVIIADVCSVQDMPAIVYVNPAFTKGFGHTSKSAKGRALSMVGGSGDSVAIIKGWVRRASSGEYATGEADMLYADGSHRPAEWRLAPIKDANGLVTHIVAIVHDISERKKAERDLEMAHVRLLDASRKAGQAEVATGVLHNVGNVLNSINVAATLVADKVRTSRLDHLGKAVALIESHRDDLGGFFCGEQGKKAIGFLAALDMGLQEERTIVLDELARLQRNIDHVKDIVGMQQSYAKASGFTLMVSPIELMEDAIRMNAAQLAQAGVAVSREFEQIGPLLIDKHRVLQILVNLISNAKHALAARADGPRQLVARICSQNSRLTMSVRDNGVGIRTDDMQRIFACGFTTKLNGHGFGLHSCALAAKEMKGDLRVISDGPGLGAEFTLEIPV